MIDIGVSPGNHGDSVVLLDRIEHFAPLGRIQKCWLFAHQNMQKPLYTDAIDQNIDNIYIYIYLAGVDPLKFGYIQSFKAIAAFWSHRCSAAMVKSSWPTGVTSWADTVKFVQLLLPHNSN